MMKKVNKFAKSFLFISVWLIISSYLQKYWNAFHWEYIYLNFSSIFNKEFWYSLEKYLFGFDIGYWIEELARFLTYEIPKELFKYVPIFIFLKSIWIKR